MTRRQVVVGMTVKHVTFYHWGDGKVLGFRDKDFIGLRTSRKVKVKWDTKDEPVWCRLQELRAVK